MARKVGEVRRKAQANLEERGIATMFLTYGLVCWNAEDEGRPYEAPLLLAPITSRPTNRGDVAIEPDGDLAINLSLLRVLEGCLSSKALTTALTDLINDDAPGSGTTRSSRATALVTHHCSHLPGFHIKPFVSIGNYFFQKTSIIDDLAAWGDRMADHSIVSALARDPGATNELALLRSSETSLEELDGRSPNNEFLVLNADASQMRAIAEVERGLPGVIQGPPGTGKSQTISNLIAALIGSGKRVLFVAEKRAALDVVKRRLDEVGLGHLILDLHGTVRKRDVLASFAEALDNVRTAEMTDTSQLHREFEARRGRLNEYVGELHRRRNPSELSCFQLRGHLLSLPPTARNDVRWRTSGLKTLTAEAAEKVQLVLTDALSQPTLFLRTAESPWNNANLLTQDAAHAALDLAGDIRDQLTELDGFVSDAITTMAIRPPASLADACEVGTMLARMSVVLNKYEARVFTGDLANMLIAATPAAGKKWRRAVATISSSEYRQGRRHLKANHHGPVPQPKELFDDLTEIVAVAKLADGWGLLSPVTVAYAQRAGAVANHLTQLVASLQQIIGEHAIPTDLVGLRGFLSNAVRDRDSALTVPSVRRWEDALAQLGAERLVDDLRARSVQPSDWANTFLWAWWQSCLDQALDDAPVLRSATGAALNELRDEFCRFDQERVAIAASVVTRLQAERAIAIMNANPEERTQLTREVRKKTRQIPVRDLINKAANVSMALKPCWMASPLAVSQLLRAERDFDVVVFDEASQIFPHDAVTSILRGATSVVAGDPKQLPPTNFFAGAEDQETDADITTEGSESLLDAFAGMFSPWTLEWHYRSHDERLIAFSNRELYANRLITFPGIGREPPITHSLISSRDGIGDLESVSAEVEHICDLVSAHAQEHPDTSLGVIALGIKHARRVEAALDARAREDSDLTAFMQGEATEGERFFVKNLERVQGDERDKIILTLGHGKDPAGRLLNRLGPLNTEGGKRRLNVAITRAREEMVLVSSFTHEDMPEERFGSEGARLLCAYLRYAQSGCKTLPSQGAERVESNPFEEDVAQTLERLGLIVIPQYGFSRYRIDLAIRHPEIEGRFVLAIECDGASYHSSPTARDRDRLRQEHLEALGWRFCRIWSTDWFTNKMAEAQRVVAAYTSALERPRARATNGDAPTAFSEADGDDDRPSPAPRGTFPNLQRGLSPSEYSDDDLERVIKWLRSDGFLRTTTEVADEVCRELHIKRRSAQFVERLSVLAEGKRYTRAASAQVRPTKPPVSHPAPTPHCTLHKATVLLFVFGTRGYSRLQPVHFWQCPRAGCDRVRKASVRDGDAVRAGILTARVEAGVPPEKEVAARAEIGSWDAPRPGRYGILGPKFRGTVKKRGWFG
jgi:very-short-patch-repair endonuclease